MNAACRLSELGFIVVQKDSTVGDIDINNLNNIGVVGTIIQCIRLPDNTFKLLVDSHYRAEVTEYSNNKNYFLCCCYT